MKKADDIFAYLTIATVIIGPACLLGCLCFHGVYRTYVFLFGALVFIAWFVYWIGYSIYCSIKD